MSAFKVQGVTADIELNANPALAAMRKAKDAAASITQEGKKASTVLTKAMDDAKNAVVGYDNALRAGREGLRKLESQMEKALERRGKLGATKSMEELGAKIKEVRAELAEIAKARLGVITAAPSASRSAGLGILSMAKSEILATTAASVGLAAGIYGVQRAMTSVIRTGIEWESAFVGVRKTVDGTKTELDEIEEQFKDLAREMPVDPLELLKIGELGGALGIAKEDLLDFTRTIAMTAEATNLGAEEAATYFAQWSNITQLPKDEIDNLANVIVYLGQNMAATESQIAQFGLRLASAGMQAGLSDGQIAALGAALASTGLGAELAGTNMSKFLAQLSSLAISGGENLELLATVAGETAEQFQKHLQRDMAGALETVLRGFRDFQKAGGDTARVMATLGMQDAEMTRTITNAANAVDMLHEAMKDQNTQWSGGTALIDEYIIRLNTTESGVKRLRNAWFMFKQEISEVATPVVDEGAGFFADLLNGKLLSYVTSPGQYRDYNIEIEKASRERTDQAVKIFKNELLVFDLSAEAELARRKGKNYFLMATMPVLDKEQISELTNQQQKVKDSLFYLRDSMSPSEKAKIDREVEKNSEENKKKREDELRQAEEYQRRQADLSAKIYPDLSAAQTAINQFDLSAMIPGGLDSSSLDRFAEMVMEDFGKTMPSALQIFIEYLKMVQTEMSAESMAAAQLESNLLDLQEAHLAATDTKLFSADSLESNAIKAPEILPGQKLYDRLHAGSVDTIAGSIGKDMEDLSAAGKFDSATGGLLARSYWSDLSAEAKQEIDAIIAKVKEVPEAASAGGLEVEDTFRKLSEAEKKAMQMEHVAAAGDMLSELGGRLTSLGPKFEGVGDAFSAAGAAVKGLSAGIKAYEMISKVAATNVRLSWESALGIFGLMLEAAYQLTSAFGLFGDSAEEEAKGMEKVFEDVKDNIDGWIDDLSSRIVDFVKTGEGSFAEFFDGVMSDILKVTTAELLIKPIVDFGGDLLFNAKGNAFSAGNVVPFARGGVVTSATPFPMAGGRTGIMGEAGPEGVVPLERMPGGKLGVNAYMGGGQAPVINVYDNRAPGAPPVRIESSVRGGRSEIDLHIEDVIEAALTSGRFDGPLARSHGLRRRA